MKIMATPRLHVWLDVDGTCEFGEPTEFEERQRVLDKPPVGRPYVYNLALFEALKAAGPHFRSVQLFTAYRAGGGASTQLGVLRCELVDFLRANGFEVLGVVTLLDPIYNKGPGMYYEDVICPVERAVLASKKDALARDDLVCIGGVGEPNALSFADIVQREEELMNAYMDRFQHPPDKAEVARYCLAFDEGLNTAVTFFDDRPDYLQQVHTACQSLGVACTAVHVTSDMVRSEQYLHKMGVQSSRKCTIS